MNGGVGGPGVIELRLTDLRQLFESMDPTPFPGKDLDADAADFIESWAREMRHDVPLVIRLHLARPEADVGHVSAAVAGYFEAKAESRRHAFRRLMALGRRSLAIGLAFLAACLWMAEWLGARPGLPPGWVLVREGLVIGGWVALWRPLEIFLYDWWPLRADRRLYRRLAGARLEIVAAGG